MNKEEIEERIKYAKSNFTDGIEILLEIIEKLEQENNKQSKMIGEMALVIASYDIDAEICKNQVTPLCNKNSLEVTVDVCVKCLKQYFENKVEGK